MYAVYLLNPDPRANELMALFTPQQGETDCKPAIRRALNALKDIHHANPGRMVIMKSATHPIPFRYKGPLRPDS